MNGYQALREHAAWIDLSERGKIRVTGEDSVRLIHALCTNDVQNLEPGGSLYAFFLNEKGRVVADAYVYKTADGGSLWLDTEPEAKTPLSEHIERYIIADDVTLTDATDELACIGIEGPDFSRIQVPDGLHTPASSTGQPATRVFLPQSGKAKFTKELAAADIPQASAEETRILRIENGFPRFGEDISDKYLAQETQLEHAIHPNKGCYLGQEIVERVRSRGQVHRLLTPLEIEGTNPPPAGSKIVTASGEAGEITSAAYSPSLGLIVALGYVRRELLDAQAPLKLSETNLRVTPRTPSDR